MEISPKKIKASSKVFFCPYCNRPSISPANIKEGIVMCAICASFQRHRFLYYVYKKEFLNSDKKVDLLHFAPEKSIFDLIKKHDNINYTYCDLMPELYPYAGGIKKEDGMHLSFQNKSFDIIIHNHLLEHMPNDIDFIKETIRVLKDDGKIIISIPFYKDELCDESKKTDEERETFYGYFEHLRMYGKDILDKLNIDGVTITIINQNDYLSDEELQAIKAQQDDSGDLYMIIKKAK